MLKSKIAMAVLIALSWIYCTAAVAGWSLDPADWHWLLRLVAVTLSAGFIAAGFKLIDEEH